jgi:RHS repeat-associated protein
MPGVCQQSERSTGAFPVPPHPFTGVHTSTGEPPTARFPGQWFQSESGLHQNWMRDYDPTTGRYLQADPLGLVDGASVYGYVRQSPLSLTDPTGECPWCAVVVAAAVAGAVSVAIDASIAWYLDECYTLEDAAISFGFGAAFSSAGYAWKGVRWGYKEFSHAVPWRAYKNAPFGKGFENSFLRPLNGNYVTPYTHAMTDYWRRIKGVPATKMWPTPFRQAARVPAWMWGAPAGAAAGQYSD